MNRWNLLLILMALSAVALAKYSSAQYQGSGEVSQPYQPAVPPPSMTTGYGVYPGNVGGGTAAGSAMNGMANAISAAGNYNLATSAAAINMTQAQSQEIKNHQEYTNTYFAMKETNQAYQKAHAKKPPTQEQLARIARSATPEALSSSQLNSNTGSISWPEVLQGDGYAQQRAGLEQLMTKKATYGSLSAAEQMQARKTCETMFRQLKSQISDIGTQEYINSRKFLNGLVYSLAQTSLS